MKDDEVWLAGTTRCAGCGKLLGVSASVFDGAPALATFEVPVWPHDEEGCPVCQERRGEARRLQEALVARPWPAGKPRPLP